MSLEDNLKTPSAFGTLGQVSGLDEEEIVDSFERALLEKQEEEDEEEGCPIGCPHKLYLHKEITDQVLLCSLCDCSF